jgi:hypothetical protein
MQTTVNQLSTNNVNFDDCNINLKYYIENIYKEITQIEKVKPKSYSQLSLF